MKPEILREIINYVFLPDTDLTPLNYEKEKRMKERLITVLEHFEELKK